MEGWTKVEMEAGLGAEMGAEWGRNEGYECRHFAGGKRFGTSIPILQAMSGVSPARPMPWRVLQCQNRTPQGQSHRRC